MNQNLPKKEKLKSSKAIEKLFLEGKSIVKFPLKVLFLHSASSEVNQVAFAVPKRNFKKAVTRNRIKRQLREAYRLNKECLADNNGKKFALLFLYIGKEKPLYLQLEKSIQHLLKSITNEDT